VTGDSLTAMEEREQRELAQRLADRSDVFDFDEALEIVQWRPEEAKRLVRFKETMAKNEEERARAQERRKRALIEEFG